MEKAQAALKALSDSMAKRQALEKARKKQKRSGGLRSHPNSAQPKTAMRPRD